VSSKVSRSYKSYTEQFKEQAMDLVRVQGLNEEGDTAASAREEKGTFVVKIHFLPKDSRWPAPGATPALAVGDALVARTIRKRGQESGMLREIAGLSSPSVLGSIPDPS
jgi:hypothetical protein